MTMHPVYDTAQPDFTNDCMPIGYAESVQEAWRLIENYFDPQDRPRSVELNDREGLWAYWPVYR